GDAILGGRDPPPSEPTQQKGDDGLLLTFCVLLYCVLWTVSYSFGFTSRTEAARSTLPSNSQPRRTSSSCVPPWSMATPSWYRGSKVFPAVSIGVTPVLASTRRNSFSRRRTASSSFRSSNFASAKPPSAGSSSRTKPS